MIQLSSDLQAAIRADPKHPVRLQDPHSGRTYLVVSEEDYLALCQKLPDELLTDAGQDRLLSELGALVGWDDPEMDIYNDVEPQL